ncbi:hypothetical protein C8R45DRAFT_921835 [Mycena sanguinolenta]|nr:hypothetical protein C8R45DRAFT_921835 [Mycena sanguinolenta]
MFLVPLCPGRGFEWTTGVAQATSRKISEVFLSLLELSRVGGSQNGWCSDRHEDKTSSFKQLFKFLKHKQDSSAQRSLVFVRIVAHVSTAGCHVVTITPSISAAYFNSCAVFSTLSSGSHSKSIPSIGDEHINVEGQIEGVEFVANSRQRQILGTARAASSEGDIRAGPTKRGTVSKYRTAAIQIKRGVCAAINGTSLLVTGT